MDVVGRALAEAAAGNVRVLANTNSKPKRKRKPSSKWSEEEEALLTTLLATPLWAYRVGLHTLYVCASYVAGAPLVRLSHRHGCHTTTDARGQFDLHTDSLTAYRTSSLASTHRPQHHTPASAARALLSTGQRWRRRSCSAAALRARPAVWSSTGTSCRVPKIVPITEAASAA